MEVVRSSHSQNLSSHTVYSEESEKIMPYNILYNIMLHIYKIVIDGEKFLMHFQDFKLLWVGWCLTRNLK